MSIKLCQLVWRCAELPAPKKIVMLRLADRANDDGLRIHPTVPKLAAECSLSVRTTQDALRKLEGNKLLAMVADADWGRRLPREYRIDVARLLQLAEGQWKWCEDCTGAGDAPVQDTTVTGAGPAPRPVRELRPIHPRKESKNTSNTDSGELAFDLAAPRREQSDFDTVYRAYPRRVARGAAERAYRAALRKADALTILIGVQRFAENESRRRTEARFIPHLATWLNAERWADESAVEAACNEQQGGSWFDQFRSPASDDSMTIDHEDPK